MPDNRNQYPFKPNNPKRLANGVILLKRRTTPASVPTKSYSDDAGWDLYCTKDQIIWPKCAADVDTGWDVNVPRGTWGLITARSSTFKRRRLVVAEGVVDPGYTGPLTVLIWNPGFFPKVVRAGERLAQLIIIPLPETVLKVVTELPVTERNGNSFGSSGR